MSVNMYSNMKHLHSIANEVTQSMLLKIVAAPYIELHSQQVAYRSSYTILGHKHCSIACLANSFEKSRKKDDIFNSNMGE